MADVKAVCNDTCGCVVPCPGGVECRCVTAAATTQHNVCTCGDHCSCNPCTCGKTTVAEGAGRSSCTCGAGCTCATCAA